MAKTYKLKFSNDNKVVKTRVLNKNNKIVDGTEPMKDVEKAILTSFVNLSANGMKDLSKLNCALDFVKQVENADNEVILDKIDIELINEGFKLSADKRPDIWYQCTEFLKQLEKPEEIKD